jgi:hypothetical protein
VLKQQAILFQVDLKSTPEQPQQKLDPTTRYKTLAIRIDDIPYDLKVTYVRVAEQSVFFVRVEERKILHDNGHEKIEKNVSDYDVERGKVDKSGRVIAAVRLPVVVSLGAIGRRNHTIVHDLVPILARHNPEQENKGIGRRTKVSMTSQIMTRFDTSKQNDAHKSIHQHQQNHADYNKERFEDGRVNRQH